MRSEGGFSVAINFDDRLIEGLEAIQIYELFGKLPPCERCAARGCASCRYCFEWAARVVQIEPSYRRGCLALYREILQDLCGGGMGHQPEQG